MHNNVQRKTQKMERDYKMKRNHIRPIQISSCDRASLQHVELDRNCGCSLGNTSKAATGGRKEKRESFMVKGPQERQLLSLPKTLANHSVEGEERTCSETKRHEPLLERTKLNSLPPQ